MTNTANAVGIMPTSHRLDICVGSKTELAGVRSTVHRPPPSCTIFVGLVKVPHGGPSDPHNYFGVEG